MSHSSSAAAPPARVAPRTPTLTGELLAEFAGTAILILFGVGVVAQVVAGQNGGADSIHWAWGLGVTFGIYVAGRTTGAHLNPAVTIALAVFQGFSWKKVLPYSVAQFLGAFVAALIVRWVYNDAIMTVDPGTTIKTQGIFATLPGTCVSVGTANVATSSDGVHSEQSASGRMRTVQSREIGRGAAGDGVDSCAMGDGGGGGQAEGVDGHSRSASVAEGSRSGDAGVVGKSNAVWRHQHGGGSDDAPPTAGMRSRRADRCTEAKTDTRRGNRQMWVRRPAPAKDWSIRRAGRYGSSNRAGWVARRRRARTANACGRGRAAGA